MIALAALLTAALQQAEPLKDPATVVSEVFKHYYNAASLTGTIVSETTDGQGTKKVTTRLDYLRPSEILVRQDYKGKNGLPLTLVSDGVKFAYDPPIIDSLLKPKPGERLFEPVVVHNAGAADFVHDVGRIYAAAHKSLVPTTLLDLAIANVDHLKDFKINLRTYALAGVVDLDGTKAYDIRGQWQSYIGAPEAVGYYELWVSLGFDLLKFRLTQPFLVNGRKVNATTTETADLKVNAAVDPKIFVVK